MSPRPALLLLIPLLSLAACSGPSSAGGGPATRAERQDPNFLEAEEVSTFATVYQAIQSLRSQWLRARGSVTLSGQSPIQVYRDGVHVGGTEVLQSMGTSDVVSIQYYDGRAAFQRWGLGHDNGVIYITSRTR